MAFTFTNYNRSLQPDEINPYTGALKNALSTYNELAKVPFIKPNLQEALTKQMLFNQYYGKDKESQIKLRGAQAGHLGAMTRGQEIQNDYLPQSLESDLQAKRFKAENPLLSQSGPAGQIGSLLYLQQHPELMQNNSQQLDPQQMDSYIQSIKNNQQRIQPELNPMELLHQSILKSLNPKEKTYSPSVIGKLQQEKRDIEEGFLPNTGRQQRFENKEQQEEALSPYEAKLGGLKEGERYVKDENGQKVGVQKPIPKEEIKERQGRIVFNELYPVTNKGFSYYKGKGSINKFKHDAYLYGKDAEATKRIDDLLFAEKALTSAQVKEAATLASGRTNSTYNNLLKGFNQSDVPHLLQRAVKEFGLPGQAFERAGVRFQNALNSSTEKALDSVPPYKIDYFHPEQQQKKYEEQKLVSYLQHAGKSNPEIMQNLKNIDKHGTQKQWEDAAKIRGITPFEAKMLYLKHAKNSRGR